MFEVKKSQDVFEIYELRDTDRESSACIAPARGGLLFSFVVDGRETFFLDRDSFTDPSKNVRGGNPILFPIAGPLQDNQITFDGQPYSMKQHGVARLFPWTVTSTGTQDAASLTMELAANAETKAVFPWDFLLRFTYELNGTELRLRQEYHNRSSSPMPMHIGFHPYFSIADKKRVGFDIPATELQDTTNWTNAHYNGTFNFDQDVIDVVFLDVAEREASLVDFVDQVRVSIQYDRAFKYLVFWTVKDAPFCCIEPWSGRRFSLNRGQDVLHVAPGDVLHTSIAFRVAAN
ncbi:MAG: aldose epimerase family protein [Candidatus Xenobia bacterium]